MSPNRIKRTNDELKATRPTLNELQHIKRLPISIIVENVRSVHNVGSIFRTADGFGASKIYLCGYTACPPRPDLAKTALGAEEAVPWEHFESSIDAVAKAKAEGNCIALVEQTHSSVSIYESEINFPLCFVVGNEVSGISEELACQIDIHLEIPMRGVKQSLNVSVATGVIGYELSRRYQSNESS